MNWECCSEDEPEEMQILQQHMARMIANKKRKAKKSQLAILQVHAHLRLQLLPVCEGNPCPYLG